MERRKQAAGVEVKLCFDKNIVVAASLDQRPCRSCFEVIVDKLLLLAEKLVGHQKEDKLGNLVAAVAAVGEIRVDPLEAVEMDIQVAPLVVVRDIGPSVDFDSHKAAVVPFQTYQAFLVAFRAVACRAFPVASLVVASLVVAFLALAFVDNHLRKVAIVAFEDIPSQTVELLPDSRRTGSVDLAENNNLHINVTLFPISRLTTHIRIHVNVFNCCETLTEDTTQYSHDNRVEMKTRLLSFTIALRMNSTTNKRMRSKLRESLAIDVVYRHKKLCDKRHRVRERRRSNTT